VGAGTGRATIAAARIATAVVAIDAYQAVIAFGVQALRQAGLHNAMYVNAERGSLPLRGESADAVLSAWAELDYWEAYRILKPGGYLFVMAGAPGTVCGELTPVLGRSAEQAPSE
jgi:ubiquinone/menaquinone biosynthesis C-methylase UbiE